MSLNVVNPDQVFRDSNGIPRAFGLLTFFNNKTAVKATIFSNEALTVEQDNPYRLDAFGRVTADIKYAGLLTIQHTNADGSDPRTIDDVGNTPPLGSGINAQTGTTYSIAAGDNGIIVSGEHAINITITLLSTTAAGDQWKNAILAGSAGTVTITGTIGAMVNPVLQPGETLVYWGNGTVYEGFVCPAHKTGVTNYLQGKTVFIDNTGDTAEVVFDIDAVIGSVYESIGPTTSGATNTWAAMDVVPVTAKAVILNVRNWVGHSTITEIASSLIYFRKTGTSRGLDISQLKSEAGFTNRSGSQETDANIVDVIIPIDSSLRFDIATSVTGAVSNIRMFLVGWVE